MRKNAAALASFLLLLVAAGIGSCAKRYHAETEKYYFVATNINLPYWQEAEAGFLDAAKALGVRAELTGPTTYDPGAEATMFRDIVEKQPSGICLSAARTDFFRADIDKAIAAGIPVICVDADVPESKRLLYIGTDNVRAGRESLKRMAALAPKGNIVVVTIPGQRNLDDRLAGVADALKNFPALKLTKILDDKGDWRNAFDQISDLILKKEKIDGIVCLEAAGGPGAADALGRFNMEGKLPIVAFDKDPKTLDLIEKGAISSTIAQKPYVMSYYGLRFLDDLHHNAVKEFKDWRTAPASPLPSGVDTGTAVVDKSNLNAFREAMAALPKPQ
ncbi:MAG TPA: substrate-binding domain-containing protein [Candidatus Polarisedimenticolia bacterium]|nr:substrate-binding domain-containing protein [Candidatus Polarisedimenticolia bacterium]